MRIVALSIGSSLLSCAALAKSKERFSAAAIAGYTAFSDAHAYQAAGGEVRFGSSVALRHLAWGASKGISVSYGSQSSFSALFSPSNNSLLNFRLGLAYGRYLTKLNGTSTQSASRGNFGFANGASLQGALGPLLLAADFDYFVTPAWGAVLMAHSYQYFAGLRVGLQL